MKRTCGDAKLDFNTRKGEKFVIQTLTRWKPFYIKFWRVIKYTIQSLRQRKFFLFNFWHVLFNICFSKQRESCKFFAFLWSKMCQDVRFWFQLSLYTDRFESFFSQNLTSYKILIQNWTLVKSFVQNVTRNNFFQFNFVFSNAFWKLYFKIGHVVVFITE